MELMNNMKKQRDKIIKTTAGTFKIRKNGKYYLQLEPRTKREEIIRCSKLCTG